MNEKLLPCPFCGAQDISIPKGLYVTCGVCHADGPAAKAEELVSTWNNRANGPCEALRRDAERYRWLREQEAEHGVSVVNVGSWPLAATCIALTYPDAESVDRAIDDAMRAQVKS